jgi:hypothetical protein
MKSFLKYVASRLAFFSMPLFAAMVFGAVVGMIVGMFSVGYAAARTLINWLY